MPKCSECNFEGDYSKLGGVYMQCQAPGGGPTPNPISKKESFIDYPCGFFQKKQRTEKVYSNQDIVFEGHELGNDYVFLLRDNPYFTNENGKEKAYENCRRQILSNNRMITEYNLGEIVNFCENDSPTPLGVCTISETSESGKMTFLQGPLLPSGLNANIIDMTKKDNEIFTFAWHLTKFSTINEIGLNINNIRGYSIGLKFLPTDFYPNLLMIIGIDDSSKDSNNQPDLLFSEYSLSITSNYHMIRLYELMLSTNIRVVLLDRGVIIHSGTIVIDDNGKKSMHSEIQKWWNSLNDFSDKIKNKDNWTQSLNQIVTNFKVGGTPITPKGMEIIEKSKRYINHSLSDQNYGGKSSLLNKIRNLFSFSKKSNGA